MILDTSFLIDLFDGRQDAFEKGLELSEAPIVQRVPSPVVMELSYGAEFGDEEERRNVRNALRMYPVVEQDETIARRAGQLLARADREASGESGIDKVDPMVAAVSDVYRRDRASAPGSFETAKPSRDDERPSVSRTT